MIAVKSATSVNTPNESQGTMPEGILVAMDAMNIVSSGIEEPGSAAGATVAGAMGLGNNVVAVFEYNNRAQGIKPSFLICLFALHASTFSVVAVAIAVLTFFVRCQRMLT